MSRAVRFHKIGGPEVLQIDTVEVPQPAEGEVRIAVKALGLNRAESMFRSGQYLEEPKFPARLGYEAAGTVESVGPGVVDYKPGDVSSTQLGHLIMCDVAAAERTAFARFIGDVKRGASRFR